MNRRRPESAHRTVRDQAGEVVHFRDVPLPDQDLDLDRPAEIHSPELAAWFDEWLACPGCSRRVLASDLCGHERGDDPNDLGPLCAGRDCCPAWHLDSRTGGDAA